MKQVICINWGTKYGPPFINRLYAMVARNITPPFRFTCFTDNTAGIRPEVDCQPLPEIAVEIPKTKRGIWPKAHGCTWKHRPARRPICRRTGACTARAAPAKWPMPCIGKPLLHCVAT